MTTNPRVDAYIAKAAPFAQPILRHLRSLVHRGCPEATEEIKWSSPSFVYAGRILCHMAAFKAHCAFGFWHRDMAKAIGADGAKAEEAMGNFGRIARIEDLPGDRTLLRYIKIAAKLNEGGPSGRPAAASRKRNSLPIPPDLAAGLKKNREAAATFAAFSPSRRRDYIEWISEAKRPETRERRLATTLTWLAQGKPRNWKYLAC